VRDEVAFISGAAGGIGRLPRVGQIGLVVRDPARAMEVIGGTLGVKRWYRSKMASYELFYRGEPTPIDWDIVVGSSGRVQVELIHIRESGPNLYHEVLGPNGSGFHHLGVVVRDFDRRLEDAGRAGIEVLQNGSIRFSGGGVCRFAYLGTAAMLGFILELIEMRIFGLQPGMPEWLLRLGLLTGDVERPRGVID